MARILCIGAHPDDLEIGMGGTICHLIATGNEVEMLDLTDGEPTPNGTPEIRAREARSAAEVLGAPRRILDMPNRFLQDTIENRKKIAAEIRRVRPDYLFAPWVEDGHPDHIAAGRLVEAARFYAKLTKSDIPGEPCYPLRVLYYFPVHIRLRVEPSFVQDVGPYIEKKERAILCYQSQFTGEAKMKFVNSVLNENRYWGFQGGFDAAEPFYQREIVALKEWPRGYL